MKRSVKEVLLSALVYPGAGHIFLKKYVFCVILIAVASIALYVLVANAFTKAMLISEKIINGEVQPDISVIRDLIVTLQTPAEAQAINIATVIILFAWLIGIIDSYRVGRVQDHSVITGEKNIN